MLVDAEVGLAQRGRQVRVEVGVGHNVCQQMCLGVVRRVHALVTVSD
jgi:hypothetical protein